MTSRILTLISAAILSSAVLTQALALEGPGRALAPSNNVKLSANTERSVTAQTFPFPVKEFVVPYAGKVRLKWQMKTNDSNQQVSVSVSSRVEVCFTSTTQTAYQAGSCEVRVAAGDLVQVLMTDAATGFIRNVRIAYDLVDSTGVGAVLKD